MYHLPIDSQILEELKGFANSTLGFIQVRKDTITKAL